jgi:hypothetical protein
MFSKTSIIFALLCTLLGIYAGLSFRSNPDQAPQVAQKQSQECITTTIKVTAKDGTVTESTSFKASSSQTQEIKQVAKKLYGLGIKKQKDFKNQIQAYEFSLIRSVNDSFDILFSYNTEQVAGVGLVLRF